MGDAGTKVEQDLIEKYNSKKKALDLGYSIGEVIPSNFDNQLDVQSNYSK